MWWGALARCRVCGEKAVVRVHSANMHLCEKHFTEYIIRKVERSIRKYKMFDEGDTVVIGVSGGKDSMALMDILYRLKGKLGMTIIPVFIDLGIKGFNDVSKAVIEREAGKRGLKPLVVDINSFFPMDLKETGLKLRRPICSICGLIKRYVLNAVGIELDAVVATGHTLDDMMAYALKEYLLYNPSQLRKLSPVNPSVPGGAKRVKPLFFVYERETLIYNLVNNISFNVASCPYMEKKSLETKLKDYILYLEEEHPSISVGFFNKFLKDLRDEMLESKYSVCHACGLMSGSEYCSFCKLGKQLTGEYSGIKTRRFLRELLSLETRVDD